MSCGFCRLCCGPAGYQVRGGGGGGGGGEIRKVRCTWDKQDITPRTRKIPYFISSLYSGNVLYIPVYK